MAKRLKIAFVVARYGEKVNGGAETECALYADYLSENHDVTVLTTKALDYRTWKNEYKEKESVEKGIRILRFNVDRPRKMDRFNKLTQRIRKEGEKPELLKSWMEAQGPSCSELSSYIKENRDNYDVFFFMTYLYATTYDNIEAVKDKAVLIPTAHDEWAVKLSVFKRVFETPAGLFYNSKEERAFVEANFNVKGKLVNDKGGVGVEEHKTGLGTPSVKGLKKGEYILYTGRLDPHKGVEDLVEMFNRYKEENPSGLKLCLAGKDAGAKVWGEDVICTGFVSEEEKFNLIDNSCFFVMPSKYESLSISVLEAFSMKKAVLCDADCEVVRNHCKNGNAGLYYKDYYEFEACINYMLSHREILETMGANGADYVRESYSRDAIKKELEIISLNIFDRNRA
ncbi:MAG: glycosyltransferase family 4 protein [Lachnospiraceae bacterium]|nr:glycosyltransferase family 4 protein [Lachnospiraceae bacterium]